MAHRRAEIAFALSSAGVSTLPTSCHRVDHHEAVRACHRGECTARCGAQPICCRPPALVLERDTPEQRVHRRVARVCQPAGVLLKPPFERVRVRDRQRDPEGVRVLRACARHGSREVCQHRSDIERGGGGRRVGEVPRQLLDIGRGPANVQDPRRAAKQRDISHWDDTASRTVASICARAATRAGCLVIVFWPMKPTPGVGHRRYLIAGRVFTRPVLPRIISTAIYTKVRARTAGAVMKLPSFLPLQRAEPPAGAGEQVRGTTGREGSEVPRNAAE